MEMQRTVGQLCEAVNSLKDQSKSSDGKLDEHAKTNTSKFDEVLKEIRAVALDVNGAKASVKTLLWVLSIVGGLLGISLGAYLQGKFSSGYQQPPHSQTSTLPSATR